MCGAMFQDYAWFTGEQRAPLVLKLLLPFAAMEEVVQYIHKELVNIYSFQASFDSEVSKMTNTTDVIQRWVLPFDQLLNSRPSPLHHIGCQMYWYVSDILVYAIVILKNLAHAC